MTSADIRSLETIRERLAAMLAEARAQNLREAAGGRRRVKRNWPLRLARMLGHRVLGMEFPRRDAGRMKGDSDVL
jgi:hypothetical protein